MRLKGVSGLVKLRWLKLHCYCNNKKMSREGRTSTWAVHYEQECWHSLVNLVLHIACHPLPCPAVPPEPGLISCLDCNSWMSNLLGQEITDSSNVHSYCWWWPTLPQECPILICHVCWESIPFCMMDRQHCFHVQYQTQRTATLPWPPSRQ